MKKYIIIFILTLFTTSSLFAQLKVNGSGQVSIGHLTPAYNLDVSGSSQFQGTIRFQTTGCGVTNNIMLFDNSGYLCKPTIRPLTDWNSHLGTSSYKFGDIWAYHVITVDLTETSDESIKENIKDLESTLEKIRRIRTVTYTLKGDYVKEPSMLNGGSEREIGFLAQDLMKEFPELVWKREDMDYYTVKYSRMAPILLNAIKEQQIQIEELQEKVKNLEVTATGLNNIKNTEITAQLFQNAPNPFNKETEIRFNLPKHTTDAFIYIYDLNGRQLKKYQISNTNQRSITVYAEDLQPGIYYYTLMAEGKEVATKKMILTE